MLRALMVMVRYFVALMARALNVMQLHLLAGPGAELETNDMIYVVPCAYGSAPRRGCICLASAFGAGSTTKFEALRMEPRGGSYSVPMEAMARGHIMAAQMLTTAAYLGVPILAPVEMDDLARPAMGLLPSAPVRAQFKGAARRLGRASLESAATAPPLPLAEARCTQFKGNLACLGPMSATTESGSARSWPPATLACGDPWMTTPNGSQPSEPARVANPLSSAPPNGWRPCEGASPTSARGTSTRGAPSSTGMRRRTRLRERPNMPWREHPMPLKCG